MPVGSPGHHRNPPLDGVSRVHSSQLLAGARAEEVARTSYGRLLALLASRSGDLASAEDALADAFRQALVKWPEAGIPENPEGWLLTVARNRIRDHHKGAAMRLRADIETPEALDVTMPDIDPDAIPDERLKLLFVCAHPAIDPSMRTPLMLQTVLGIEAEKIAAAFLVPASAMAQRLVRVKRKIKEARIPFVVPGRSEMHWRMEAVLEAVYGAYAIGWDGVGAEGSTHDHEDLGREALFLARLLAELAPREAEALGLAALVCHAEARRSARLSPDGHYIPLDQQDAGLWDFRLIADAETYLAAASGLAAIGRIQLEAAIQSVHANRAFAGATDWKALELLYEGLVRIAPGIGAAVGRAVAVAQVHGPAAGLVALDLIDPEVGETYQPWWAARAWLLAEAGRSAEAVNAYRRAADMAESASVRSHLMEKLAALGPV